MVSRSTTCCWRRRTGGRADAEFHIVESPALVDAGARLFEADRRVNFHDRLPASLPPLDLLHISTALQYVDDYPALLTSLIAYRPRYVLMVDLPAGDIPTFATGQVNVRGSVIPSWFFNAPEIIALVESAGYRVTFKALSEQRFDLGNFPVSHRLPIHVTCCLPVSGRCQDCVRRSGSSDPTRETARQTF